MARRSGRVKKRTIRIAAGFQCRIALASDLHNSNGGEALAIIEASGPDLIAVTGDLFWGHLPEGDKGLLKRQKNILPFVKKCVEIAPTYLSLGNHEWLAAPSDLRALTRAGALVLDNEWKGAVLNGSGEKLVKESPDRPLKEISDQSAKAAAKETGEIRLLIGGLTSGMLTDFRDFQTKYGWDIPYPHEVRHTNTIRLDPESLWLEDFEKQDGFKILLCHHPEYWKLQEPMLAERKIDLVLAGHAHGGQIRLFGHGLFAPGQGVLPKYTGGLHRGEHGNMVISRGLSNTAPRPIPRLFNPPEVVIVGLY